MEKIYKSEYSDNFIIGNVYFPIYEYKVYNEGDFIFIEHLELEKFAIYRQDFKRITDKDGNTFATVQDCLDYLIDIAGDPVNDTPTNCEIKIESKLYLKRIADGRKMSRDLMSELRVNSKTNGLPRSVNKAIETKLEKVKLNIDRGWWVTAKEELDLLTIDAYFTQELFDRINLTITNYIAANYD